MKILNMRLENFQGIKSLTLDPEGKSVSIFGDNGTGKTTIFNAFCWLMYGKPSTNAKGYSPKTAETHGLNHVVEMKILQDSPSDGNPPYTITLKKDYHEVWKVQKGDTEKKFDGHTTDYYIDDVPIGTEKEFKQKLLCLIKSDDIAKILTRYNYFLEDMSVKERRKLLLDVCGDISDADIIASEDSLEALPKILENHTVDEYLKIATAQLKKINEELAQIPNRIDEAERAKPETAGADKNEIEHTIELAEERLTELREQKAALTSTVDADIRREIAEVEADRSMARTEHMKAENAKNAAVNEKISGLTEQSTAIQRKIGSLEMEHEQINLRIMSMKTDRERLLNKWNEVASRVWEEDTKCPLCHQELPADQIEAKKAEFNRKNSQEREEIKALGLEVSEEKIEAKKVKGASIEQEIFKQKKALEDLTKEIEKAKEDIKEPIPFIEDEYDLKVSELRKKLNDTSQILDEKKEMINALIKKEDEVIVGARSDLAAIEMCEKQEQRIRELEERRITLRSEGEDLEQRISICGLFNRRKAELLSDKINNRFKTLKFRLFKEQINGGIEDDCEALIPCDGRMVEFKDANNASRINAGLEVIDALSEFYGVSLPVFVDNAESCVRLEPTKAQQIRLYVSGEDKTLRTVYG